VIIIAATPIGNLRDHSPRLIEALEKADLIVAEDTRKAKTLLTALGVKARHPIRAMHDHNERAIVDDIVSQGRHGDVVVLTDAGMPGISDPGYVVASKAHDEGVTVSVIPGPSAVISALAVSGLPTDRFSFEGFIPKKGRQELFDSLAHETRTMVFFDAPQRLADSLTAMAQALGEERRVTVCRELTKMFEEVIRGSLRDLIAWSANGVKGEITLVVEGTRGPSIGFDDALKRVGEKVAAGQKVTDAARTVAQETGYPKRELYDAWSKSDA